MVKPFNLLFICTHNRCRSVLAEVIANTQFEGVFRAFSAGVNLQERFILLPYPAARGFPIEGLSSQSWDDFADQEIWW